jgi:hypothetical protein
MRVIGSKVHGENFNLHSSTDMIRVVIVMDGGHVEDKCIENRVIYCK